MQGAIGPRRPFTTLSFLPGVVLPDNVNVAGTTFPVSGINLLENSAQSWYDAGYANIRRRFSRGWTFLANYTFAKSLSDAPDFRSPMFESAIPQNNRDLSLEKGPACDIRHRFALSAVYDLPALRESGFIGAIRRTPKWTLPDCPACGGLPASVGRAVRQAQEAWSSVASSRRRQQSQPIQAVRRETAVDLEHPCRAAWH